MTQQARRQLHIGLVMILFGGLVAAIAVWPSGPQVLPLKAQEIGPDAGQQRLQELQDRYGATAAEADPASKAALLASLASDIQGDLAGSTFNPQQQTAARQLLVGVLCAQGDDQGAVAQLTPHLDTLMSQEGDGMAQVVCRRMAEEAQARGQLDLANALYGVLQARWPQEGVAAYAAYRMAECLEQQGAATDARAAYQSCISAFPEGEWTGEAYLGAARCCWATGDNSGAETLYRQLQTARPGSRYPADAQREIAEMRVQAGQLQEAISAYEELKGMLDPSAAEGIDAINADLSQRLLEQ